MNRFFRLSAGVASLILATASFAAAPPKDIVDTAASAGSFNTLVAAVKAAGLVDTLKGADRRSFRQAPRRDGRRSVEAGK